MATGSMRLGARALRFLVLLAVCSAGVGSFLPAAARLARSTRRGARTCHPRLQLVRVERSEGDDDDNGGDDGSILQVSQVVDEHGEAKQPMGRSVASMQFMITNAMRAQLITLGYSTEEIDAMDPPRAAEILAEVTVLSSKGPQEKPKSKAHRFELAFTCNVCNGRNSHSISHHAYNKGTVIVTCPGCGATHLVADNLNWIEQDFRNLEEFMAKRGSPVTRIASGDEARVAAAAAAAQQQVDAAADEERAEPPVSKIDGITDEQALRIREAVRANKRRQRQERAVERLVEPPAEDDEPAN